MTQSTDHDRITSIHHSFISRNRHFSLAVGWCGVVAFLTYFFFDFYDASLIESNRISTCFIYTNTSAIAIAHDNHERYRNPHTPHTPHIHSHRTDPSIVYTLIVRSQRFSADAIVHPSIIRSQSHHITFASHIDVTDGFCSLLALLLVLIDRLLL